MWEQIRSNQIRSTILVIAMAGLLLLLGYALGELLLGSAVGGLIVALVIWGFMTLLAYFQGDSIFLAISRARRIGPEDHPRLHNVVEEMKIASGLEYMPAIYIIDDPALNAFATGRDPKKASIAITSGLLEKLNRDELQGVIGHEMAHIKNRDVLLMTMCGILLGSIVILAYYASRIMFVAGAGRRSSGRGGGGALPLIIIAIVLMILAPIAAQLIYYAISRKREYLADASSALYTRYPEGLASALEKIGGSPVQIKTANKALAPMYIANPFRTGARALSEWTSTHPPLAERIRILRSMGGASYADYSAAYARTRKGGGAVIPASAVAGTGTVGLRGPSAESVSEPSRLERHREVSDLLWKQSNYRTIECGCGIRLRVPPGVKRFTVRCPRCGRSHSI